MKKFILAFTAIVSLTVISCRQEEDVLSAEDMATIKIIETNRNAVISNSDQGVKRDSATNSTMKIEGEIQRPPRK